MYMACGDLNLEASKCSDPLNNWWHRVLRNNRLVEVNTYDQLVDHCYDDGSGERKRGYGPSQKVRPRTTVTVLERAMGRENRDGVHPCRCSRRTDRQESTGKKKNTL